MGAIHCLSLKTTKTKKQLKTKNSVALVRKQTVPTEGRSMSAKLVPTFCG
jgi:hypothetical protein